MKSSVICVILLYYFFLHLFYTKGISLQSLFLAVFYSPFFNEIRYCETVIKYLFFIQKQRS